MIYICSAPPQEAVSVLKQIGHYMILQVYTVMMWGSLVEVWGGLGCFNGPHDGYANSKVKSNSQTSLPRALGSPTDSRTVLLRSVC